MWINTEYLGIVPKYVVVYLVKSSMAMMVFDKNAGNAICVQRTCVYVCMYVWGAVYAYYTMYKLCVANVYLTGNQVQLY